MRLQSVRSCNSIITQVSLIGLLIFKQMPSVWKYDSYSNNNKNQNKFNTFLSGGYNLIQQVECDCGWMIEIDIQRKFCCRNENLVTAWLLPATH